MEKHQCDACGFKFDGENPQLRALRCPACHDGIARPQSQRTIREVWARVGNNHHRLFYAEGPVDLLEPPHTEMVHASMRRTKNSPTHRIAGAADEVPAEYDGVAVMVNGEIVEKHGDFDLPEPVPDQTDVGEEVVVERGKATGKRRQRVPAKK